jgi:signal transduction histidine kinase
MTIRRRLTLWYAGIMFVSVLALTGRAYLEFAKDRAEARAQRASWGDVDAWQDMAHIGLTCGIPAALIALVGGWWLMRKAMAPIAELTRAAAHITERNLNEPIPRSRNGDEFDQLAGVFNEMTSRLDQSFNRIREFTLHASHELKTPLTIMHGEVETALAEEASPAVRERLHSQLDELQRLSKIVDGLTLLTKADAGQIVLTKEPVRLDELVRDCYEDAGILADPHDVSVELSACEGCTVIGDRHRLRQLLLNLTDNAIKYNVPKGRVAISLGRANGFADLTIGNTGPGISPAQQPRVFEQFFRGEAARNGAIEGCGLGLSIAQWIVTAHNGKIEIVSEPGELTTMRVRLPEAQGRAAPVL